MAKNGPKLQEAKPGDTYPNGIKGPEACPRGHDHDASREGADDGSGGSHGESSDTLSQQLGRTVMDQTGLKGNYDFTLSGLPIKARLLCLPDP